MLFGVLLERSILDNNNVLFGVLSVKTLPNDKASTISEFLKGVDENILLVFCLVHTLEHINSVLFGVPFEGSVPDI